MPGALIGLLLAAAYVALIVFLVRWGRRRLQQRADLAAEALRARGANILGMTPRPPWRPYAPAVVDFELGGRRGAFQVRRWGRDWVHLAIHIVSPPLPGILIRAESGADRMGKTLGLNREVQLGDEEFDKAAYIDSSAPDDTVKAVLASADVRSFVRHILALGYRVEMSRDGMRATRLISVLTSFDAGPVPEVMRALDGILPHLPRFDPATTPLAPLHRLSRTAVASAVLAGVAMFGFFASVRFMTTPVDDSNSAKALGIGVLAWVVVVVFVGVALRGRSRSFVETLVTAVFLLFAAPFVAAAALFWINAGLDSGAPTTHTTKILSMHRSRDDNEIRVVPWDPDRTWQKVGVSWATYKTLHTGDRVEIDVHPGTLGWPWVSGVRRVDSTPAVPQ